MRSVGARPASRSDLIYNFGAVVFGLVQYMLPFAVPDPRPAHGGDPAVR
jgi:hypothetical protein